MISYQQFRANKTAFAKAQQASPIVIKTVSAYVVLGATGIYSVFINHEYSVGCSCPAGRHGKFCYHAAAALILHLNEAVAFDEQEAKYEEREMARHDRPNRADHARLIS